MAACKRVAAGWALVGLAAACGPGAEVPAAAPAPTALPVLVHEPPASEVPPPAPAANDAQAGLEMWWSDAGTAIARCVQDGEVALTLLTASGEQQPVVLDYAQAGWSPYAIGAPAWRPGTEVVALPHDRGVVLWDAAERRARTTVEVLGGTAAAEVTWSPDGARFATFVPLFDREETAQTEVHVWEASGAPVRQVRPDPRASSPVELVSLGKGGDVVGTGGGVSISMSTDPVIGERVVITSLGANRLKSLEGHTVVIHPNGLWAVASGIDGWDGLGPATTTIYGSFGRDTLAEVPGRYPAWNGPGTMLKTETEDAVLLSAPDGRRLLVVPGEALVMSFAARAELSPNGRTLAVADRNGAALWDVPAKRRTRAVAGAFLMGWAGDGAIATSDGEGKTIHVTSTKSGDRVDIRASLDAGTCRLRLATPEGDERPDAALAQILGAPPPPRAAAAPAPRRTPPADPAVHLTHGGGRPSARELELSWAPDETAFVASTAAGPQMLVDLTAGTTAALPTATKDVIDVAWNEPSSHLAVRVSGGVEAWRRAPARRAARVPVPDGAVATSSWAPTRTERLAVSWLHDVKVGARVALLDTSSGRVMATLAPSPPEYPPAVSWRPDGRQLLTRPGLGVMQMEMTSHLQIWDVATGRNVASFTPRPKDHVQATYLTAWHPTNAVVYTGAGSGTYFNLSSYAGTRVSLWDAATGKSLGSLPGHTAVVDPTGTFLAVVDGHPWRAPETPRTTFYDLATRKEVFSLAGVPVAFDPDGRWSITAIYPHGGTNIPPSSPIIYRMWDLPRGATPAPALTARGRLALGTFDSHRPVDHVGGSRFVVWGGDPHFSDAPQRFVVWDLATSSRVAAARFDEPATVNAHRWLRGGRILQLRYEDGRHRFVALADGAWLDVIAGTDGALRVHDASGPTTWNALAKLVQR